MHLNSVQESESCVECRAWKMLSNSLRKAIEFRHMLLESIYLNEIQAWFCHLSTTFFFVFLVSLTSKIKNQPQPLLAVGLIKATLTWTQHIDGTNGSEVGAAYITPLRAKWEDTAACHPISEQCEIPQGHIYWPSAFIIAHCKLEVPSGIVFC